MRKRNLFDAADSRRGKRNSRRFCTIIHHKDGAGGLVAFFIMMVLELRDGMPPTIITRLDFPPDWKLESSYQLTQPLGAAWYEAGETLLLKVPSAVVPEEFNFVLNARHPDFAKVQIREREPFRYDHRFIAMEKELVRRRKAKKE